MQKSILILAVVFGHFLTTIRVFAQTQKNTTAIHFKDYTSENGFEVFHVNSMVFDDLGWLWISGTNLNASNSFLNYQPIIQRFDGQSFYTLKIPVFTDVIDPKLKLIKRNDGQLYVHYSSKNKSKLYLVNPEDLVFKEIELPEKIIYEDLFLFIYKDDALVYLRNGADTRVFKLSEKALLFTELSNKPITKNDLNDNPNYSNFIPFENHFIINDDRNGIYSYLEDGSVVEKITHQSLGLNSEKFKEQLFITTWFRQDHKTYILFNHSNDYYLYEPDLKTWTKSELFKIETSHITFSTRNEQIYEDGLGNFVQQKINQQAQTNTFYLNKDRFYPARTIEIPSLTNSNVASRDFSKELYIEFNGSLRYYTVKNQGVITFLKNLSIRNMYEISNEEILVATENTGWYLVNLNSKIEQEVVLNLNNKPFTAYQNRKIFNSEKYFWSNDDNGIIKVDKKTNKITSYIYFPVADMVEDERYIYYGTNKQNLMRFDKIKEKNEVLIATKNYDVLGIIKIENALYLATATGLLVYENRQLFQYKVNDIPDDSYFLTIAQHKNHGILLGSRSGKVYRFNPKNKQLVLLYEDHLKASIASFLFDDAGTIWINTFNGIVAFNPFTKTHKRFSISDGLSFYEANRYSALKTADGHFLVGTLKGLNYFHPEIISKKTIDAKLIISSLTYFDKTASKMVTEMSPKHLSTKKVINLPADSKSIFLKFGLLGMYDVDKINYRYRLNDEPWISLKNTNELKLFSLAPGNYNLLIEAIDSTKNSIGKPINLSIHVDEFFYNTGLFYGFIGFLIFILSFWYYREQRKKLQLKTQFATQIIRSQEQERVRIAKDLHDSIGQRLLILKNTLLLDKVSTNMNLIEDTIKEVRNISHNLHPFQFEKLGLMKSLENLLDAFQKTSSVFYSYEIDDISGLIPKEKELFIFRMLQECIANVEKHANATACNLTVTKKLKRVVFKLKDNGKGFSVENAQHSNASLGMQSLKERAQYINAFFDIKSEEGQGTIVTIKINY